jgi:hypothetical protein
LATRGIRAFAVRDFIPDALRALQKAVARAHLTAKSNNLGGLTNEQEASTDRDLR